MPRSLLMSVDFTAFVILAWLPKFVSAVYIRDFFAFPVMNFYSIQLWPTSSEGSNRWTMKDELSLNRAALICGDKNFSSTFRVRIGRRKPKNTKFILLFSSNKEKTVRCSFHTDMKMWIVAQNPDTIYFCVTRTGCLFSVENAFC